MSTQRNVLLLIICLFTSAPIPAGEPSAGDAAEKRAADYAYKHLERLFSHEHGNNDEPIDGIHLYSEKLTDADLSILKEFKYLQYVDIRSPLVTDAGLKKLSEVEYLAAVHIWCPLVTDDGLKYSMEKGTRVC